MSPRMRPQSSSYVRFLLVVSGALIASALFHTVVFLVKGTPWEGFVSWRKPIIFALSFAITDLTVAWVLHALPRAARRGWILAVTFGLAGFVEVALITLQQWRGVPSHFNTATSFDLRVVIVMGAMFVPLCLSILGIVVWSWTSLPRGTSLALGMRIGMGFLIFGQVTGFVVLFEGIDLLRQHRGNIAALYPAVNAFKMPHALSLHAAQALIVIGALADRALPGRKAGRWAVLLASLSILAAVGLSWVNAA